VSFGRCVVVHECISPERLKQHIFYSMYGENKGLEVICFKTGALLTLIWDGWRLGVPDLTFMMYYGFEMNLHR
jgi:hypothetical protein